jgi:hypothetical protein
MLYENTTANDNTHTAVNIQLNGSANNKNAIGAKLLVCSKKNIYTYEKNIVRGFMSSMETPVHIGLKNVKVDSAFLIWPDNSFQKIILDTAHYLTSITYAKGLPFFDYTFFSNFNKNNSYAAHDITASTQINFLHKENLFNEFAREPLIPHEISAEGPALAVGDINNDGLEDVFIGSAKTFRNAIFLQQSGGKFIQKIQPAMIADSMYEDVDATFADVNNDGNIDLLIASGGNEFYGADKHLLPRLYLNDGKANFVKSENAFDAITSTTSCIVADDFNKDGFVDVFVGGRAVPWNYGDIPSSYLLQNNGKGKFIDVTKTKANQLVNIGMVTDAVWYDIDKDGDDDLIVCCEWGSITAFINDKGSFTKKELTDKKGWWNCIIPVDINNDGAIDFIAGNLGLNSRLHASAQQPLRMYFNDFDDNGKKEQIVTYYIGGKEIPYASKDELQKQMPMLKKKYLYAEDFAKANLNDLFFAHKMDSTAILTADYFANALLINDGKNNFTLQPLPWQAQLSSIRDAAIMYKNKNSLPDILPASNFYYNNIASGRYDADYGTLLLNNNGQLFAQNLNGLIIKGEVRRIAAITIADKPAYIFAKNNDSVRVIQFDLSAKK